MVNALLFTKFDDLLSEFDLITKDKVKKNISYPLNHAKVKVAFSNE